MNEILKIILEESIKNLDNSKSAKLKNVVKRIKKVKNKL